MKFICQVIVFVVAIFSERNFLVENKNYNFLPFYFWFLSCRVYQKNKKLKKYFRKTETKFLTIVFLVKFSYYFPTFSYSSFDKVGEKTYFSTATFLKIKIYFLVIFKDGKSSFCFQLSIFFLSTVRF